MCSYKRYQAWVIKDRHSLPCSWHRKPQQFNGFNTQLNKLYHTVEPLTNDHPHQRPSLSYDHISCDGQWFLFVYKSLTSDHPSYTTTPMWFWGWSYKRGSTVSLFDSVVMLAITSYQSRQYRDEINIWLHGVMLAIDMHQYCMALTFNILTISYRTSIHCQMLNIDYKSLNVVAWY